MTPPFDRRAVGAWCLFDWANSAFPAVITTFVFATYFTQAVATDPVTGTAQWGHALAVAGLTVAVLSPILGSVADLTGRRKAWLAIFAGLNIASIAALWFVRPSPDSAWLALVGITLATIAFEIACVFYNALLPDIAPSTHIGRISGWGWGLGYVGGIVCLGIVLVVFVQAQAPPFGLDKGAAEHVRAASPFSAVWYAVFAIPLFVFVREPPGSQLAIGAAVRRGLTELAETARTLRNPDRRPIFWFLLAHMIYADGLTTLFAFGGIYAAGTFGMALSEVILFGVALNVTAGIGALAFAWVDDWIGPRRTITISLGALMAVSVGMLIVESKTLFWGLGLVLGAFFGPVQSASRSIVARLAPPEHQGQMFGLLALSGRITAFVGPAVLAWATTAAGSQRAGMATILVFFAVGGGLLAAKVPETVHA